MAKGIIFRDKIWSKLYQMMLAQGKQDAHVRVGVLASQGGGATHPGSDITMIELAAIHEFGSPAAGIPERSFIRSTFADQNKLLTVLRGVAKSIVEGKSTIKRGLGLVGVWAAAAVKATITEGKVEPPLEASTIAAKGSSLPLVDTGRLLGSITHEVVEGKK